MLLLTSNIAVHTHEKQMTVNYLLLLLNGTMVNTDCTQCTIMLKMFCPGRQVTLVIYFSQVWMHKHKNSLMMNRCKMFRLLEKYDVMWEKAQFFCHTLVSTLFLEKLFKGSAWIKFQKDPMQLVEKSSQGFRVWLCVKLSETIKLFIFFHFSMANSSWWICTKYYRQVEQSS